MEQNILENLDLILLAIQHDSKILINPCMVFNPDHLKPEVLQTVQTFDNENDISDSKVTLYNLIFGNNNTAGLAMKMWIDWSSLPNDTKLDDIKNVSLRKLVYEKFGSNLWVYHGLNYEKCVYEFITKNIITENISPNFIPLIASHSCILRILYENNPNLEHIPLIKEIVETFPEINLNFILTGSTVDPAKLVKFNIFLTDHIKHKIHYIIQSNLFEMKTHEDETLLVSKKCETFLKTFKE